MDSDGKIAGNEAASLYYKVPVALALSGDVRGALRSLDWIAKHLLTKEGALSVPKEQSEGRAYDRGWMIWGASLCQRYDIALRLAKDLRTFQNSSTGGFWDSRKELAEGRGRHHAMTVGMAGWGLLAAGRVQEARRAGDFLIDLLDLQPAKCDRIALTVQATRDGQQQLDQSEDPSDYVDCTAVRQRPARIGPAQVLLVRLFQLLGDERYLKAAWGYTLPFLDGPTGIYDCVESHKFLWGVLELHRVNPEPRLRAAAERSVEYILSRQRSDGQWLADATGGGAQEQSLDLRLNTTCNVLVGFARYLHLAA